MIKLSKSWLIHYIGHILFYSSQLLYFTIQSIIISNHSSHILLSISFSLHSNAFYAFHILFRFHSHISNLLYCIVIPVFSLRFSFLSSAPTTLNIAFFSSKNITVNVIFWKTSHDSQIHSSAPDLSHPAIYATCLLFISSQTQVTFIFFIFILIFFWMPHSTIKEVYSDLVHSKENSVNSIQQTTHSFITHSTSNSLIETPKHKHPWTH